MSQYRIRPMARLMPSVQTFKDSMNCMFRYSLHQQLTSTAGAAGQASYRMNSLFDPYVTGVGGQPRYFDQLTGASGPYLNYRVTKATARITFYNMNSSNTTFGYVYARVSDNSALLSAAIDPSYYTEGPDISSALISTSGNDNSCVILDVIVDPAKFFGGSSPYDLDELLAAYNANPQDTVFLEIGYRPADLTTSTSVQALVEMVFHTQLTGLGNPGLSLNILPAQTVEKQTATVTPTIPSEIQDLEKRLAQLRGLSNPRQ